MKSPLIYASRIMHRLKRVCYVFFILQTLAWTSCQKNEKPSVLIIALDKLSSDLVTCTDEPNFERSGLAMICKESIRFTHSYTTSTHSAAAMGSILTGEYPIKHKLFRSFDKLSPLSISVTKIAKENNYVTSFFSGSPFILKKTGLSDYFDLFDDSIASSSNEYDQDFNQQSRSFFQWIGISRHPFFSVIYNSELNKLSTSETDQSSFEKLDEKLHQFFVELKASNRWDNTYIFLVGLNGSNKFNRYSLNFLTNLHSENTNIATLVKTPRQKGDEGINWKNDLRISLIDIGFTLQCLMSSDCQESKDLFPALNMLDLWKTKNTIEIKKDSDRPILVQTTDTFFIQPTQHRFSILEGNYNFIQNNKNRLEIYNTLSDKSELTNLSQDHEDDTRLSQKYLDYINRFNTRELVSSPTLNQERAEFDFISKLNFDFWTRFSSRESILINSVDERNPLMMYSLYSLQKNSRQKIPKNIESHIQKIKSDLLAQNACLGLLNKNRLLKDDLKLCSDDLSIQYLLYTRAGDLGLNQEKNKLLYSVMKSNYKNMINRTSINLAYANAWGLYNPSNQLVHPLIFLDSSFFDN